MNYDTMTYEFEDIDLERAVGLLDERSGRVITLLLMGFSQVEISGVLGISRSMVAKIIQPAVRRLSEVLGGVESPSLRCGMAGTHYRDSQADWSKKTKGQGGKKYYPRNIGGEITEALSVASKYLAREAGDDPDDVLSEAILEVLSIRPGYKAGYYIVAGRGGAIDYLRSSRPSLYSRLRSRTLVSLDGMLEFGFEIDTDHNVYHCSEKYISGLMSDGKEE